MNLLGTYCSIETIYIKIPKNSQEPGRLGDLRVVPKQWWGLFPVKQKRIDEVDFYFSLHLLLCVLVVREEKNPIISTPHDAPQNRPVSIRLISPLPIFFTALLRSLLLYNTTT